MARTLDMQFIRYLNLFGRISRIQARHCFSYNNMIIFVVPARDVQMAIGQNNINLRKLSGILSKRIRIVAQPRTKSSYEIKHFIATIVSPIKFTDINFSNDEIVITADMEGKSRLIGRNRVRQEELAGILKQYFGIRNLRIA